MTERAKPRQAVADSMLLGVLTALFATVGIIADLRTPSGDLPAVIAFVGWFGAPLVALLNLFFVIRDWASGRRTQAALAVLLCAVAVFSAWWPLLEAD